MSNLSPEQGAYSKEYASSHYDSISCDCCCCGGEFDVGPCSAIEVRNFPFEVSGLGWRFAEATGVNYTTNDKSTGLTELDSTLVGFTRGAAVTRDAWNPRANCPYLNQGNCWPRYGGRTMPIDGSTILVSYRVGSERLRVPATMIANDKGLWFDTGSVMIDGQEWGGRFSFTSYVLHGTPPGTWSGFGSISWCDGLSYAEESGGSGDRIIWKWGCHPFGYATWDGGSQNFNEELSPHNVEHVPAGPVTSVSQHWNLGDRYQIAKLRPSETVPPGNYYDYYPFTWLKLEGLPGREGESGREPVYPLNEWLLPRGGWEWEDVDYGGNHPNAGTFPRCLVRIYLYVRYTGGVADHYLEATTQEIQHNGFGVVEEIGPTYRMAIGSKLEDHTQEPMQFQWYADAPFPGFLELEYPQEFTADGTVSLSEPFWRKYQLTTDPGLPV